MVVWDVWASKVEWCPEESEQDKSMLFEVSIPICRQRRQKIIGAMEYDRNRPRAEPKIYEPTNSEMKTQSCGKNSDVNPEIYDRTW